MALGLIKLLSIAIVVTTIYAYKESSVGNFVTLNLKDGSNAKSCQKAYKIFFEGCNLYPGAEPGCIVRINDFWDGSVNSDYYKIASVTKISNVCHYVRTPFSEFGYSEVDRSSGYNSELWLMLTKNTSDKPWGYFIIPLSAASTATTLTVYNAAGTATSGNANNLLPSTGPLATYDAEYNTPLVLYKGTNGQKYFYFLQYLNSATVFDAIAKTECPQITVDSVAYRNCWDTSLQQGYLDFVSTGIRTNFALWIFIGLMLIFFVYSNSAENETALSQVFEDNNVWFLNPLWSIWNYGSIEYNKKARMALLLTTMGCQEFVVSIVYKLCVKQGENIYGYIFGYSFIAWGVSMIVTYLLGSFLHRMYQATDKYADDYKRNKNPKFRDYLTDKYDLLIIQTKFEFYSIALALNTLFFIGSIALTQHMEQNDHWHWFGSLGLIWVWDVVYCDIFIVLFAKFMPNLIPILARRGYYIKYSTLVKIRTLELD